MLARINFSKPSLNVREEGFPSIYTLLFGYATSLAEECWNHKFSYYLFILFFNLCLNLAHELCYPTYGIRVPGLLAFVLLKDAFMKPSVDWFCRLCTSFCRKNSTQTLSISLVDSFRCKTKSCNVSIRGAFRIFLPRCISIFFSFTFPRR